MPKSLDQALKDQHRELSSSGGKAHSRMTVEVLLVFELGVDFLRVGDIAHIAEVILRRSFPSVSLCVA